MNNDPLRVIIRVCVTDIPATRGERVYRLACDFSDQILHRPFNNNLKAEYHDAIHFLPLFDSENPVRAWFLYDFNVTGPRDKKEVLATPRQVYHATRQGDSWVFTPRERWIDEARKYCARYIWGARYRTT